MGRRRGGGGGEGGGGEGRRGGGGGGEGAEGGEVRRGKSGARVDLTIQSRRVLSGPAPSTQLLGQCCGGVLIAPSVRL